MRSRFLACDRSALLAIDPRPARPPLAAMAFRFSSALPAKFGHSVLIAAPDNVQRAPPGFNGIPWGSFSRRRTERGGSNVFDLFIGTVQGQVSQTVPALAAAQVQLAAVYNKSGLPVIVRSTSRILDNGRRQEDTSHERRRRAPRHHPWQPRQALFHGGCGHALRGRPRHRLHHGRRCPSGGHLSRVLRRRPAPRSGKLSSSESTTASPSTTAPSTLAQRT